MKMNDPIAALRLSACDMDKNLAESLVRLAAHLEHRKKFGKCDVDGHLEWAEWLRGIAPALSAAAGSK